MDSSASPNGLPPPRAWIRSWRWWCSVIALAALGWATIKASQAEQASSGWVASTPAAAIPPPPADPKTQLVLEHILQQSQLPLLRWAAPDEPPPQPGIPTTDPPRTARQSPGADGWRSASESPPRAEPPPSAADSSGTPDGSSEPDDNDSHDAASPFRGPRLDSLPEIEFSRDAPEAATPRRIVGADPLPRGETSTAEPATAEPDDAPVSAPEPDQPSRPALSRQLLRLRAKVRGVLTSYYRKPLNSRDNDPWEVMHGMLAYELHSRVRDGGPRGNPITAVGWLCYNRPCKGMTLLYVTPQGELRAKHGVGLQGHHGQFLALLAQCRVSPDYPIRVGSHQFTIHDLVEAEKKTCYPSAELTFKLIALVHYLDLDEQWVNDQGQQWNIPRLIREELAQPIRGAACGGTHRLAGLSLAVKARLRSGQPLDGQYRRAAEFVEQYQKYAFRLQNRDGSLSTRWFQGRGNDPSIDRRLQTTGHILEWLVYQLDDEDLRSARMVRAVDYLATLLASNYQHDWEAGPLGHAIHGLFRYDQRVFQPYDEATDVAAAAGPPTARRPVTNRSGRR